MLLERAKQLHPETTFGAEFPFRFREQSAAEMTPAAGAPYAAALVGATVEAGPASQIPDGDDWEIPIICRVCEEEYTVTFQYLHPGVVFYCPHCQASFVPTRTIYLEIASALESFSGKWHETFEKFQAERRQQLAVFESRQRDELERFQDRLRAFARQVQHTTGTRRRWRLAAR